MSIGVLTLFVALCICGYIKVFVQICLSAMAIASTADAAAVRQLQICQNLLDRLNN